MSEEPLIEQYKVNDSFDKLKELCHEAGGAENVFTHTLGKSRESSLEDDIAPWLPNYRDLEAYQNIKAFQRALDPSEKEQHKRRIERMKFLLRKVPVFDKAQQGARLREEGMRVSDICKVLDVSTNWYNTHCRPQVNCSKALIDIETVILKLEEGIKRREVERGRYGI